jgi:putative NADH-flavin reductase
MDFFDCCKQDATVKKVIAVVGATGQQGGGLVQAILDDPKSGFAVRALTRDPTKVRLNSTRLRVSDGFVLVPHSPVPTFL